MKKLLVSLGILASLSTLAAHAQLGGFNATGTLTRYLQFGISGGLLSGITRYLTQGIGLATNEVTISFPRATNVYSITVSSTGAPGGSLQDTFTLRKNATDTALVAVLSGASTFVSSAASSPITYAAGDKLSIRLNSALLTGTTDPMVLVEYR